MRSSEGLQVRTLGGLTVFADGRTITLPGSRKTRALLGYLVLQSRPVTREYLCELLWPHPDDPRAALRWSLTKLRPILNGTTQHLVADRMSVRITGLDDRVDLPRVNDLLRKPIEKLETAELEAAAELFHGELLEGLEIPDCHRFNEWLFAQAEAARRSRRTILEALTARLAGDPEDALVHARARVTLDPLDEGAHIDVVRLLGALGKVEEAHGQAARCRELLDTELGAAPGPMLAEALRGMKKTVRPAVSVSEPVTVTPTRAVADAGLFGRAEECVRLETFLASRDVPGVLLLEGEPGIGKSRLLIELRRRAEGRGILALIGRSWEVEMIRPFGVWIDLLAGLPHDLVPPDLRTDLAPIMPSLGESPREDGKLERLLAALESLARSFDDAGRAVVFVFDDIQWIDQASIELLAHVSSRPNEYGLRIACAGRPGELVDNESARSLIRGWNRAGCLERLFVEPLPDRDAAALARALSDSSDVEGLVASCGGNPLYLIESLREGPVSASGLVTSLIADRLATLDEPTGAIARWAAVLGHAFPAARMANLLSQTLSDLLTRTEALERHGILRPHGNGWDFAHDMLRQATLAELSGPRRALMHRHIAHVMAAEPDPDGTLAGEVVFHAVRAGEPQLAARAAVSAGDRALRLAAFEDAWRVAERGLVEAAKLPAESSIDLTVELLRVQVLAGRGRRLAKGTVERLTQLAGRAGTGGLRATERTARWLLSVVTEEAGDFDAARRHSLGAERASRTADPQTRLRALANTARCLAQLEREPKRARELLGDAQKLSDSLATQVLDIPWGMGMLCAMEGRPEEARVALERGKDMAREEGNHWAGFECLSRLSMLDLAEGDLAGVIGRDPALREMAEKLGEGSEKPLAGALLALARRQDGDDTAGLDQALDELRAADSKGLLAYVLCEAGRQDLAEGDTLSASRRAEEALEAAGEVGRSHQQDRAMLLKARTALAIGDEETIGYCDRWLEARLADASRDVPFHGEFRQVLHIIANRKGAGE